jgi:hypothetical protein
MVRPSAAKKWSPSLLKQIIKRRPRIAGAQAGGRRSLLLPRHAHLIRRTLIPRVLLRHPFLDRLHALKPAPRIKIRALFTGMQFKPALRTLPVAGHPLQHRAALGTPRHRPRPRQIHRPRSKRVVPLRWTALALFGRPPRLLTPRLTPRLTIAILIPMLTILCSHTPSPARPVLSPRYPPPGKPRADVSR